MNENRRLLEHRYHTETPLRTFFYLLVPDWKRLGVSAFFLIIKDSPMWVWPIFLGYVVNVITAGGPQAGRTLWIAGAGMLLLFLQNIPTHTIHVMQLSRVSRRVELSLRAALVRRLQELSISFHNHSRIGQLQSKLLRDVENIYGMCGYVFAQTVGSLFRIVFAFATVLVKGQYAIAVAFVVAIPISAFLIRIFHHRMRTQNTRLRSDMENMSARLSEMIEMIPITRAHGAEQTEIRQIEQHLEQVRTNGVRLDFLNGVFGATSWVLFRVPELACVMMIAFIALRGGLGAGDVILYSALFMTILGPILQMVGEYPVVIRGLESIRSIGEVLECPDLERNEGKARVDAVAGAFSFQDITYVYPGKDIPALQGLNLDVKPGETIAIVGESGSGKSTLMSLIVGFRRPTIGRILLDGRPMEELDLRQYRRSLAVVPQETILFSGSIRENVVYGLENVDDAKVRAALDMANVSEFVSKLPKGMDTLIGERGTFLSGGQRQRIAIARALIRDPKVIVFDEATSHLDVVSERLVQEAVGRLIQNRTTFIVAHRLSTIRNADRVVVLREGLVVETGSPAELAGRNGEFSRFRQLQG